MLMGFQRNEMTEYHVYKILVRSATGKNSEILKKIAEDEKKHANTWAKYTGVKISPDRDVVFIYFIISKIFGFTFALRNSKIVGVAGLITGIAASLSMSASEYLSQKSEEKGKNPRKASFYTEVAYILTVMLLIVPYFIFSNYYIVFGVAVFDAFLVILFFTFFVSVVKEIKFKRIFSEMITVSSGVALISFIIGWFARKLLHVEI